MCPIFPRNSSPLGWTGKAEGVGKKGLQLVFLSENS
ncbi:hypothetical protein cce_2805 [Crocosphaera subtropica ATCC 51142]|uniref:Uncharacterized protein n=1 Tax=Crocosphaera subtropica (strain ATCC 51142 / BH68) TaxID=43989 RepID=B1WU91_CROS5|nr:hypothetical protein cce_2805 [Crocosphaera subtropica ATCC 51142]